MQCIGKKISPLNLLNDAEEMSDPLQVPQELISEAESLLQTSSDRTERRNAWAARIARYFAYCVSLVIGL